MNRLYFTLASLSILTFSVIGCESANNNADKQSAEVSAPFDTASCFIPEGMAMCTPPCQNIIVDAHKISDQDALSATAGITTIPYEITTPALKDSIGDRRCNDKWRIKLDTLDHMVTFEIQDSANAPGYFSSALITGILNDKRTESEEPIKFTFFEARDSQDSLHFIFNVLYANTHIQYYNISDLPTTPKPKL